MTHKTHDRASTHRTTQRRNEQDTRQRHTAAQAKAPKKAPARKLKLPAYVRHA